MASSEMTPKVYPQREELYKGRREARVCAKRLKDSEARGRRSEAVEKYMRERERVVGGD